MIAGSDSSGGAWVDFPFALWSITDAFRSGLEADQKVIAAHGCYAMTATTALTAQNTQGVYDIHHTPSAFVGKQIDACIDDIGVDVVKTGRSITGYSIMKLFITMVHFSQLSHRLSDIGKGCLHLQQPSTW